MAMKAQRAELFDCLCRDCHERNKERQGSGPRYRAVNHEIKRFCQALEILVQAKIPHHDQVYVDLLSAKDAWV